MPERFFVETLGCPKNEVDSDKIAGSLLAAGLEPAMGVTDADLVVVNTCAFIGAARAESVAVIMELARRRRPGARLVVTGCLAARAGEPRPYGGEGKKSQPLECSLSPRRGGLG